MEKLKFIILYFVITGILGECPDEEKCCFGLECTQDGSNLPSDTSNNDWMCSRLVVCLKCISFEF